VKREEPCAKGRGERKRVKALQRDGDESKIAYFRKREREAFVLSCYSLIDFLTSYPFSERIQFKAEE